MYKFFFFSVVLVSIAFLSCSKDEDSDETIVCTCTTTDGSVSTYTSAVMDFFGYSTCDDISDYANYYGFGYTMSCE